MAEQTSGTTEAVENKTEVDPWIAAFAAIEQRGSSDGKESADSGSGDVPGGELGDSASDDEHEGVSAKVEDIDSIGDQADAGGLDTDAGDVGRESTNAFADSSGVTEESIQQYEEDLNNRVRDKAIADVAAEFMKRGVRNNNGKLGATLDDFDICKRDSDGVPRFYNPETGREFTGDNPRRQAQEWVDDYNKELARVFNQACEQYEMQLKKDAEPRLAVMKFAPKYDKLDDIRKGMFDNVIQDYEITDTDGKVIGYSCDLDKALAMVERQINMIQSYAKQHQAEPKQQPSGPALDMKTSSGAVQTGDAPIKSLEDAMLRLQQQQLDKLKNN